jgi:hypothetical protein
MARPGSRPSCRRGRKMDDLLAQLHHAPAPDRGPRDLPTLLAWRPAPSSSPAASFGDICVRVCGVRAEGGEERVA